MESSASSNGSPISGNGSAISRKGSPVSGKRTGTSSSVVAVSRSAGHTFSKDEEPSIALQTGRGVAGDAHNGHTVKHRSRVARDPSQPNLRQVHLIHQELLDELTARGFMVEPGSLGENITTLGLDVLALSQRARLHIGATAIVEVTGLRNPCAQLDKFQRGLTAAVLDRDEAGRLVRKAGIMGIVVADGEVMPGDKIRVVLPRGERLALEPV